MKARHFKKLRAKLKYFDVERSGYAFGWFRTSWDSSIQVLANNHWEACLRAKKRGYSDLRCIEQTYKKWANFRVKLSDKPDNFRYIKYFR